MIAIAQYAEVHPQSLIPTTDLAEENAMVPDAYVLVPANAHTDILVLLADERTIAMHVLSPEVRKGLEVVVEAVASVLPVIINNQIFPAPPKIVLISPASRDLLNNLFPIGDAGPIPR